MTAAPAIACPEARYGLEPLTKGVDDGAFRSFFSLTGDNFFNAGLLKQIVNVPVELLLSAKVAAQSLLQSKTRRQFL